MMQLSELLGILDIDRFVVSEGFRDTTSDPQAILNAWFVGSRQVFEGLLELRDVEAPIIEGQACQEDSNIWMTPFRGRRWNSLSLADVNFTETFKVYFAHT